MVSLAPQPRLAPRPRVWLRGGIVLAVALAAGVATFLVNRLASPVYESQALVSVTVSSQVLSPQLVTNQLLANLPTPAALAQAFTQLMSTRALSQALGSSDVAKLYDARFDERKALLTLRAKGGSPGEAKQRAEKLLGIAQSNLQERLTEAARANANAALEQARIDTTTAARVLEDVQRVLRGAPRTSAAPGVAAGLEALKVDPAVARSSNPAFTYLSLQEAQQLAALAQARARAEALQGVLTEADALRKLVGQALQVQVLAPPAEPLGPVSPRPLRTAALVALATAAAGAVLVLLLEAFEGTQEPSA